MIDVVKLHDVFEEIEVLIPEHYNAMREKRGFDFPVVDWDYYNDLSRAGHVITFIMREGDNIGAYAVFTINEEAQHKGQYEAINDTIYIKPPLRHKTKEFFEYIENYLNKLHVRTISYHINDDVFGRFLKMRGFNCDFKIWSKRA